MQRMRLTVVRRWIPAAEALETGGAQRASRWGIMQVRGWQWIGIRPDLASIFSRWRGLWAPWAGVLHHGGDGVSMVAVLVLLSHHDNNLHDWSSIWPSTCSETTVRDLDHGYLDQIESGR